MATVQIDEVIRSVTEDVEAGASANVTTYGRLAPVYDFLFGGHYDYELQRDYIARNAPDSSPFRLLEAGCGTGRLLESVASAYPEADVCGVDLHEQMVELARDRVAGHGNAAAIRADVLDIDGEYDVVAGFNLLPHFDEETVAEFFRLAESVLVDDGTLVFDYKDPRNNPDGLYDVWEDATEEFRVTARFLTVYDNSETYYAVAYEFERRSMEDSYTTGELMDIHFQRPAELEAKLREAGFRTVEVSEGVGDQSGVIEAWR